MTTPSQTVGPYLSIGLPWPDGPEVVPEGTPGRIRLYGKVFDGEGAVIPDALIETWQADADGKFGTDFRGFGRAPTNDDGEWEIFTFKPGRIPTSTSTSSPAACSTAASRGSTSPTPTRTPYSPRSPRSAAPR